MVVPIKIRMFLLVALIFVTWGAYTSFALDQNFYFITAKTGYGNTGEPAPMIGSNDTYIDAIQRQHGGDNQDRTITPFAVSFEFYRPKGSFATGFGLESYRYSKSYSYPDGSKVHVEPLALLFSFSFYMRDFQWWFPYVSIGTGNFTAKVREKLIYPNDNPPSSTKASFLVSANHVFYYEVGTRFPITDWGLFASWRWSSAKVKINTISHSLELGGQTSLVGVYFGY